ncbi:MAG: YtxH domain-containing protein [Armatimonadota bacterium]
MDKNFLLGIFIGAAIGAVVTLLYTPSPGPDMRVQIADKSRQAADALVKAAAAIKGRVGDYEDHLRQAM